MELRLDGKVALVTGASRGIGRAIAGAYAEAGARVMISSRKQDALDEAAATMAGHVATFAAHAGHPDEIEACVGACVERLGGLDILVNNAATNPYMGPNADIDLAACVEPKQFHDVVGYYNRFDVFKLTVDRSANRPVSFTGDSAAAEPIPEPLHLTG